MLKFENCNPDISEIFVIIVWLVFLKFVNFCTWELVEKLFVNKIYEICECVLILYVHISTTAIWLIKLRTLCLCGTEKIVGFCNGESMRRL